MKNTENADNAISGIVYVSRLLFLRLSLNFSHDFLSRLTKLLIFSVLVIFLSLFFLTSTLYDFAHFVTYFSNLKLLS